MTKTIKIRCNGRGKHVNDVDLEAALAPVIVTRGAPAKSERRIPERLVLPCRFCTEGKVIIERAVIEENLPPAQS
jgi:hypothetical protein